MGEAWKYSIFSALSLTQNHWTIPMLLANMKILVLNSSHSLIIWSHRRDTMQKVKLFLADMCISKVALNINGAFGIKRGCHGSPLYDRSRNVILTFIWQLFGNESISKTGEEAGVGSRSLFPVFPLGDLKFLHFEPQTLGCTDRRIRRTDQSDS